MKCTVLIIDDDKDDIEFLIDALGDNNVRSVQFALNAVDAFSFLQSIKNIDDLPKVVVTDVLLPGVSGTEFISILKNTFFLKHIPIIVFSSLLPESELERYSKMDAVDFIEKPSNYQQYLELAKMLKEKIAA